MKILILTLWCLIPVGLVGYHYGPGTEKVKLDETAHSLDQATVAVSAKDWAKAISEYEAALGKLPKEKVGEARRIRLELAKARIQGDQLPKAREELAVLSEELNGDASSDPALRDETLSTLASSRFYMTYLMKLEGLPESDWEPEIDAARQEQKLLVQRATEKGDTAAAARYGDDLESAIRLARMEPEELYGKAIPKQCSNCSSCKKPGNKVGKKPGQKPKDDRGAGSGPPADNEGS